MISVSLYRKDLVAAGACSAGLAMYDAIAALQPATDTRRGRRLRVRRWTTLHTVWLHSVCSSFAHWAEIRNLIPRADLSYANLSRANLAGAYLSRADLAGADLSYADLAGANLSRADLAGADLSYADLSYANLSRADLAGADLSRADLSSADLSRAYLAGAYRGSHSAPIPGWHTRASGYLEKDGVILPSADTLFTLP